MKKLVFLILMVFSSATFCSPNEHVHQILRFVNDKDWESFKSLHVFKKFPHIKSDNHKITPYEVGLLAFEYAETVKNKQQSIDFFALVPPITRSKHEYALSFVVFNGLEGISEFTLSGLREYGIEKGFRLPVDRAWLETQKPTATNAELQASVATGAPVVAFEGEKSSVTTATTPAETTKPEDLQTEALLILNKQFDLSKKEVERLQGELAGLKKNAGAVASNTNKIEALEEINSKILERLEALKGSQNEALVDQNSLAKLLRSLGVVIDGQLQEASNLKQEMEARMEKVETSVSEQDRKISGLWKTVKGYHTVWLSFLSLAVVLLCAVVAAAFFYGRRRVDALDFRVKEVGAAVDSSFANEDLVRFVDPQDRERIKTVALKKLKPGEKIELTVQVKKGNEFVPFKLVVEYNNKESLLVNIPRNRDAIYGSMTTVDKKTDLMQMMRNAVWDKRLPPPLRVAL